MFSRQYHINCLSIQKHVHFHIFSIFGRLYHINCETDMHILYFRSSAMNITLIGIFLSTLLHLVGFILMRFAEIQKRKFITAISHRTSSCNLSIIFLTSLYHHYIPYLSSIYLSSIYLLSTINVRQITKNRSLQFDI
jgi:hypothetical protein